MQGFASHFKDFMAHPFSADMKIWPDYVLLVGATILIILFWNLLLFHFFNALKGA